MSLRKGSKVWVEDRDLAWAPAEITNCRDKLVQVVAATGKKVLVPPEKLFPRDADEDEHGGVDDMTKLTYLNEPGVLYNLRRRYALNDIYEAIFRILAAILHLGNVEQVGEQVGGVECGYYVMQFMKEIVNDETLSFPTKWEGKKRKPYDQSKIDEVRLEVADYIQALL